MRPELQLPADRTVPRSGQPVHIISAEPRGDSGPRVIQVGTLPARFSSYRLAR
jgi:hypothetical protein